MIWTAVHHVAREANPASRRGCRHLALAHALHELGERTAGLASRAGFCKLFLDLYAASKRELPKLIELFLDGERLTVLGVRGPSGVHGEWHRGVSELIIPRCR
jgi:hypothetical protein